MILFTIMCFLAGVTREDNSLIVGLVTAGVFLMFFGPLFLYGAYERGKDHESVCRRQDGKIG